MPAIHAPEIQTVAETASIDTNRMLEAYGASLNGAVPECTEGAQLRSVWERPFG